MPSRPTPPFACVVITLERVDADGNRTLSYQQVIDDELIRNAMPNVEDIMTFEAAKSIHLFSEAYLIETGKK